MTVQVQTSSIGRVLIGLAVLWGMIGLLGARSWAADSEYDRATLRGVQGVQVLIEHLKPELERAGLTEHQLRTDVELQLRKAGIPVLSNEERRRIPGHPYLYVIVTVVLRSEGLAAYTIQVELNQRASLESDASLAVVSTWSVASTGSVGNTRLVDTIRNYLQNDIDQFINAYLSVHPRPAGSAAPASTSSRR